jgi:predicted nucleic acid-binding protein
MIRNMGMRKIISVYADTSVFGGVFDEEFRDPSKTFIDAVSAGTFALVTSELVRQEIAAAPSAVRQLFEDLLPVADNAVNKLHGYGDIAICSPLEVIEHEDEEDL